MSENEQGQSLSEQPKEPSADEIRILGDKIRSEMQEIAEMGLVSEGGTRMTLVKNGVTACYQGSSDEAGFHGNCVGYTDSGEAFLAGEEVKLRAEP